ncbi:hypothetical protein GCM10010129_24440 [Streptomyces fumigatiscleroticus]|nr:hypothetical protein GCM10010129_24440 [Streptomyces fumigatiscleroticus]
MTTTTAPGTHLWERVRDQVCRHVDGIAIGSTVAALRQRGVLHRLGPAPRDVHALAQERGANPGYFQVALRLLADQGWVVLDQPDGDGAPTVRTTRLGERVLTPLTEPYTHAAALLPALRDMFPPGDSTAGGPAAVALLRREWDLPRTVLPVRARVQVLAHLDGHLAAPAASWLPPGPAGSPLPAAVPPAAAEVLVHLGWARPATGGCELTEAGRMARTAAAQYGHVLCYLSTLARVPDLLFGTPAQNWAGFTDGHETHLDRDEDLAVSGQVFETTCREPLLDVVLPLFDRPLDRQPRAIVDMGCGDGELLRTLCARIRHRTLRGRSLDAYPLLAVGADPSSVARRETARRLTAAGIPHLVVDADITAPDHLVRTLARHGVDARDALHVSKSVIHNRRYLGHPATPPPEAPPPQAGGYATPDGAAIAPHRMALDLARWFSSWRGLARRHGMVAVEAHAVAPERAAALIGRTPATVFDATHGYSHQYPVTCEVFAWAARTAGFRSRAHREPAAREVGHTILTVDHFVPTV